MIDPIETKRITSYKISSKLYKKSGIYAEHDDPLECDIRLEDVSEKDDIWSEFLLSEGKVFHLSGVVIRVHTLYD